MISTHFNRLLVCLLSCNTNNMIRYSVPVLQIPSGQQSGTSVEAITVYWYCNCLILHRSKTKENEGWDEPLLHSDQHSLKQQFHTCICMKCIPFVM